MDQKNTIIGAIIIILILVGGFIWWNNDEASSLVDKTPTSNDTASTNNNSDSTDIAVKAYTQTRVLENGKYVTIVNLTNGGFVPPIVYINSGESVRFVNKDNESMRIATNEFQNTPLYAGFGQEKSVGTGGTYEFIFSKVGVWGYNNMSGSPKVYGIVNVR